MSARMIRKFLTRFTRPQPALEVKPAPARKEKAQAIHAMVLAMSRQKQRGAAESAAEPVPDRIEPYRPPKGVIPTTLAQDAMAMDSTPYDWVNSVYSGAHFKGYPYLALLSQQPEYRKMSETIAKQMTRKWIKVRAIGGEDKSDKVKAMEHALKEFHVQALFRKAAELDGLFGRGQIYIDVKKPDGTPAQADPE